MRSVRILLLLAALAVPLSVGALTVPYIGSPFAHMTLPFFEDTPPDRQTQTAAASTPAESGEFDVCWNAKVFESSGNPVENYSNDNPNFTKCEETPAPHRCTNQQTRPLAGYTSYADSDGVTQRSIQRCTKAPEMGSLSNILATQAASIDVDALHQLNPLNTADQTKLVDMYKALNVPEATAQTMVSSNPQGAYNFLDALSTGDQTQIQQAAKDFQLSPNIASQLPSEIEQNATSPDQTTARNSSQTGQGQCGIAGWAGQLAYAESYCGQNAHTFDNCGTGRGACGTLQFQDKTYQNYLEQYQQTTGDMSCAGSTAANTDCAVKVTNSYYDKWLQSSAGQSCVQSLGSQSQCVYAYHWMGGGGLNSALNVYNADPNASASALCSSAAAAVCSKGNMSLSGLSMSQMFQQLDTRMGIGTGDVVPNLVSGGTGVPGPVVAANNQSGNAMNLAPGVYERVGSGPLVRISDTPTNPINSASNPFGSNSMQQMMQLMMMQNMMASMQQRQQAVQQAAAQQQAQQQAQQVQPPSLILTVQPLNVKKGDAISVSWSAANASASTPCTVTANSVLLGQGNTGSATFRTSTTTPASVAFLMACLSTDNLQTAQQSATATVQ